MNKELLKEIILEQTDSQLELESGIERDILPKIKKDFKLPHAIIISGLRRCGKSTLLRQIRASINKESYYFNFEDERLIGFSATDFNVLFELLCELEGEKKVFFLDEIQNIPDWERFVRRMIDRKFKFFLTGSNASLLSRELGTRLTGRQVSFYLTPFSFKEYLSFKKINFKVDDLLRTQKRSSLKRFFSQYLQFGGMPEYLTYANPELLKAAYSDILYRDIIV
ncbi:MAG: ATP-binding protein, partial [Candidatus Falkowbacteria bacterium]|nr:ATP-binding protein [Candidatus Falkowbacteria bacterium]